MDATGRRRAAWAWYVVFGPPLFAFALWRSVWWQWVLPPEDFVFDVWLWFACVAGILVALSIAKAGWNWRMALIAAAIVSTIWPVVVILIISPVLWLMLLAPGYLAYWLVRRLARSNPAWRLPLAIALVPLFVATLAAMPPLDSYKWLWPWVSFRAPILRFQDQSDAAADRLGLPVGRKLTKAEIDAWSAITPLRLRLRYPIVGTEVTVSAINPWTDERFQKGFVWAWWGGPGRPTFGLLNVRTMHILSASD
jgi:hypothetical protein